MGFLDSYKRLDNLCKDLFNSSVGITSYISEMEYCQLHSGKIYNWESDYRNLKHYRYIRNQIVHENCASESLLCNTRDVLWLEEFHHRILNQTDPLSQYQKIINRPAQQVRREATERQVVYEPKQNKSCSFGLVLIVVIVVLFVLAFVFFEKLY